MLVVSRLLVDWWRLAIGDRFVVVGGWLVSGWLVVAWIVAGRLLVVGWWWVGGGLLGRGCMWFVGGWMVGCRVVAGSLVGASRLPDLFFIYSHAT